MFDQKTKTLRDQSCFKSGIGWQPTIRYGKVWRGGRGRLRKLRGHLDCTPASLAVILFKIDRCIEFNEVQFIPVVKAYLAHYEDTQEQQNILEIFVGSNVRLRERLHGMQEQWHSETRWYVVVRGEWLGSSEKAAQILPKLGQTENALSNLRGNLLKIVPSIGRGESFRLYLTSKQTILIDLGHDKQTSFQPSDCVVFLSHSHPDHAGGLYEALKYGLHVLASPATIRLLHTRGELAALSEAEQARLCPIKVGEKICTQSLSITPYAVPHSVGSVAWLFSDSDKSFMYIGDIMLRSQAYGFDWIPPLKTILHNLPGKRIVLLEASRAHTLATANDEVEWPPLADMPQNVLVITNNNPERLLNSYIRLYKERFRSDILEPPFFLLSGAARLVLESCWDLVQPSNQKNPDALFIKPKNFWGAPESRYLYWLDRIQDLPLIASFPRQKFWFVDKRELEHLPQFKTAEVYDL